MSTLLLDTLLIENAKLTARVTELELERERDTRRIETLLAQVAKLEILRESGATRWFELCEECTSPFACGVLQKCRGWKDALPTEPKYQSSSFWNRSTSAAADEPGEQRG